MKIKNLIEELNRQENHKFKNVASTMRRVADKYEAGGMTDEDFAAKVNTIVNLLKIYGIKEKVKYKVAAQMVEDLLKYIAVKGVSALF